MKRFQRPINEYTGSEDLSYRDKYQQDSNSIPKIAISSAKMDSDFNYVVDAVNTLDEDIKSIVYSGIANQTILAEHISNGAVTAEKMANNAVTSKTVSEGSITNAKLADLAVTTPKLANNSVTKDKIASDSVGTEEILDGSITKDKLADDALSDSVPVGTIAQFSVNLLPTGWILCSGATLSKNSYPKLVKFLTGSDTSLEATLPNLNTNTESLTKFAIKAFSDTVELATLDVATFTQDIANNNAAIATKADKFAESIATVDCASDGSIKYSDGVKSVTKFATGQYKILLDDSLVGKEFDVLANTHDYAMLRTVNFNYVEGSFSVLTFWTDSYNDREFTAKVFPRKGEV
jgi:microcystin-dependent protein